MENEMFVVIAYGGVTEKMQVDMDHQPTMNDVPYLSEVFASEFDVDAEELESYLNDCQIVKHATQNVYRFEVAATFG